MPRSDRTCDHCHRRHDGGGLCAVHQRKIARGLPLDSPVAAHGRLSTKGLCIWEDCSAPAKSYDLCNKHYLWVHNYGFGTAALPDYCEVCGSTVGLVFDHDHACCPEVPTCGSCLRGRLCRACNHALGNAKDNPAILRKLADYLEETKRIDGATVR